MKNKKELMQQWGGLLWGLEGNNEDNQFFQTTDSSRNQQQGWPNLVILRNWDQTTLYIYICEFINSKTKDNQTSENINIYKNL